MKLRSAVGIGLVWVATVAGVSATAWVAIDRAGRDVTGATVSPLSSLPTSTAVAPGTRTTPATSRIGPPPAGDTPRSAPSSPVTIGSATVATQAPRDRSSVVAGGQISVRCSGADILLRIAQPDNGWRVNVKEAGPRVVDLTFDRDNEDVVGGTRVTAVCDNTGTPAFTLANTAVPGD